MAEIMSRTDLFSPADHRSAPPPPPLSRKRLSPSLVSFPFKSARCSSFTSDFYGRRLVCLDRRSPRSSSAHALSVQMGLQSMKWWEKGLQINMKEIESAQDLADALLNAGNRLVVLDFFSPGCGGCRSLHPKICQIAEMNPHVMFLHVNYEEHKSMCYTLNVHVLPFFRFYRGAQGRVCSFSCTNATIKKFRDALAKHTTDCCSLGPAKGLKESELMALVANKDLSFNYTRHPEQEQVHTSDTVTVSSPSPTPGHEQVHMPGDTVIVPSPTSGQEQVHMPDTVTVPTLSPTPGQEQVHTPGDTVTVPLPTTGQEQVHTGQEQVHTSGDTVTVLSPTPKHPILVGPRVAQEEALAPTGR